MRAVMAKKLRKKAREMSAGMPERQLLVRKGDKTAFNAPQSTRGIYLALKRAVRRFG